MQSFCRPGAAVFLSVVLSAVVAHGAVICVDPGGPPCSATVQAGVDAAAAGDTVEVASGLYFEAVTIPAGKDGLILTGKGTIDPQDVPPDPNEPPPPAITVESANVTIEGLSIQNGNGFGIHATANGLKVNKVTIRGPEDNCIFVEADNATISACVLNGCGFRGIEIAGNNAVLTKNKIDRTVSDSVLIEGAGARIEGNKITQPGSSDCVDVEGDNATVSKNNLLHCDGAGVSVEGDNAIVTGNKMRIAGRGVDVEGDQPNVSKNKVSGTDGEGYRILCQPCTGGTITKNKVGVVVGDDNGFSIFADGADPNDPNEPSQPSGLIVESNSASTCADAGFEVFGAGVTLRNNIAKKNGGDDGEEGFDIHGTGHTLEGNKSMRNFSGGFTLEGTGHTLTGNTASDNLGDGFRLDAFGGGHALTGNQAKGNLGQGFAFPTDPNDPPAASTLIENKATGNRTDYCAESSGNVLTDNSFGTTALDCLSFN